MIEQSEQTMNLWSKIFKIQEKNLTVIKTAANAAFKQNGKVSKYADLNSILDVIIPELNEVKLVTAFMLTGDGLIMQVTDIESGEWIRFACQLNLTGQTAQQIGSQITYFRRYMFNSMFNLQAEDDDGNSTSGVNVVPSVETPKATAVKPNLLPNTAASEQLKKDYAAGKLTKFSQITEVYNVSDQVKLGIQATMPKIDFNL
jgi:hypothetical protein